MKKIRLLLVDADGCSFNYDYHHIQIIHNRPIPDDTQIKDVIEANREWLDLLKEENKQYDEVILATFSLRSSIDYDAFASRYNHSESSLLALKKIADYLDVRFDPFLLADIFGDLESGTSFSRLNKDNTEEQAHSIGDTTKLSILYPHLHRLENPEDQVFIDCFDDLKGEILDPLSTFFQGNKKAIPQNRTLRLYPYKGKMLPYTGETNYLACIEGTGVRDAYYRQTVIDLTEIALILVNQSAPLTSPDLKFLPKVTLDQLKAYQSTKASLPQYHKDFMHTVKSELLERSMQSVKEMFYNKGYKNACIDEKQCTSLYDAQLTLHYHLISEHSPFLFLAIRNQQITVVSWLIQANRNQIHLSISGITLANLLQDSNFNHYKSLSPLELALLLEYDTIAALLIENGANLKLVDYISSVSYIIDKNLTQTLKAWLKVERDPRLEDDASLPHCNTLVHYAVAANSLSVLSCIANVTPHLLSAVNQHGFSALDFAVAMNDEKAAAFLAEQGVKAFNLPIGTVLIAIYRKMNSVARTLIQQDLKLLSAKTRDGHTLLHAAVLSTQLEIVEELLNTTSFHADIDINAEANDEVLKDLEQQIKEDSQNICRNSGRRWMKNFDLSVLKNGIIDKKLPRTNKTAIHYAITLYEDEIALYLFEKGAVLPPLIPNQPHIVHVFARQGRLKELQAFVKNAPLLLNHTDHCNFTPLMWAAARGHAPVVQWLLEQGAELEIHSKCPISMCNKEGDHRTALGWAKIQVNTECIDLLTTATEKLNHCKQSSSSSSHSNPTPSTHIRTNFLTAGHANGRPPLHPGYKSPSNQQKEASSAPEKSPSR